MDDPKRVQEDGEAPKGAKAGFDRRSAIKRVLVGAAAVGVGFAPTIKAYASSGAQMSGAGVEVTTSSIVVGLQSILSGATGVSQATKNEINGKFDTVLARLKNPALGDPTASLTDVESSLSAHLAELNAANGGFNIPNDDEVAFAPNGWGLGNLFSGIVNAVKTAIGNVVTFVKQILAPALNCYITCTTAFATNPAVNIAVSAFLRCYDKIKHVLVVPTWGKAMFVAGCLICAGIAWIGTPGFQTAINTFVSCLKHC